MLFSQTFQAKELKGYTQSTAVPEPKAPCYISICFAKQFSTDSQYSISRDKNMSKNDGDEKFKKLISQ
jgi:hypothetical protein